MRERGPAGPSLTTRAAIQKHAERLLLSDAAEHHLARLKVRPDNECEWSQESFSNAVRSNVEYIVREGRQPPASSVPPSRQAREARRQALLWERDAVKHPKRAQESCSKAAGWRSAERIAEARANPAKAEKVLGRTVDDDVIPLLPDPEMFPPKRHRTHHATEDLTHLVAFVRWVTGRPHYGDVAAILTAEGHRTTAARLRGLAFLHAETKKRRES